MNANVERHHLRRIQHARRILQLLPEAQLREFGTGRKPLGEFIHHEPVLKPSQIGKAEDDEDCIALVVDFGGFFLVDDDLDQHVGGGRFGGGDAELEEEGAAFGEGFVGVRGYLFGCFGCGIVVGASSDSEIGGTEPVL